MEQVYKNLDDQIYYNTDNNDLNISVKSLVKLVHKELKRYDDMKMQTSSLQLQNPYTDPIRITVGQEKYNIPRDIKNHAIKLWNEQVRQNNFVDRRGLYADVSYRKYDELYNLKHNKSDQYSKKTIEHHNVGDPSLKGPVPELKNRTSQNIPSFNDILELSVASKDKKKINIVTDNVTIMLIIIVLIFILIYRNIDKIIVVGDQLLF